MNFKLDVNNDYTTFSHTFELIKQENGTIDLKEIKKSIVLLNNSFGLGALDKIWDRVLKSYKYEDVIQCLEKELSKDVINELFEDDINVYKIFEGNKKNYFEIKSSILITLLSKYKGSAVPGTHYPPDGTKSLNLVWDGVQYWNTNTKQFLNGHLYDLSLELKNIMNYKKLNIIYHSLDNKWWITFLGLP
jgi:hypothetical protein